MRFSWTVGLLVLLTVGASPVFADGGVLTFRSIGAVEDPPLTPIRETYFTSARTATMPLDGDSAEDVFLCNLSWPHNSIRLVISKSEPYRLYCDLNGDGKAQPTEITIASVSDSYTRTFERVPLPVRVEDVSRTLRATVLASVYSNDACHLQLTRIDSFYEGNLTIGGVAFPARLALQSLDPTNGSGNSIVILDTDGDGSFNHFQDSWISGRGIGLIGGDFWKTETSLTGATAEVSLTPYQGPTGVVEWKGEAIHRAYLNVVSATDHNSYNPNDDICLPLEEDRITVLPEGEYRVSKVWLRSGTSRANFFQYSPGYFWGRNGGLRIVTDATATRKIGGPLSQSVGAGAVSTLLGFVQLDLEQCQNGAGLEFTPVGMTDILRGGQAAAPSYEIHNSKDVEVCAGQFEYG